MLSRLLDQWGLFSGIEKDQNNESQFFQTINEWMFFQANASWDRPDNMQFIDPPLGLLLEKGVRHLLSGKGRSQYLGDEKTGKYAAIQDLDIPWSWKDPRNIFTIDVWKKIFPTSRLIHIFRNPVDVANSLRLRENRRFAAVQQYITTSGFSRILTQGEKFRASVRCLDIHQGVELWKAYEEKAIATMTTWKGPTLLVKYEDLLQNPLATGRRIADFSQLSPTDALMKKTLAHLDSSRRFAFIDSDELMSIYEKIRSDRLVKELGYGEITPTIS